MVKMTSVSGETKTTPIAVVGAGRLAQSLVQGLQQPFRISDNGSGAAESLATKFGGVRGTNTEISNGAIVYLAHPAESLGTVSAEVDGHALCVISLLSAIPAIQLQRYFSRSPVTRAT